MNQRRVVITGMGVISPLGLDLESTWQGLLAGRSGIRRISLFDPTDLEVQIAAEVHGFDPLNYMPAKEARRTDRFVQIALAAFDQAQAQSGLLVGQHDPYSIGAIFGSGMGGIQTYTDELNVLNTKGPRRVSPFLIPSITIDTPAVHIALRSGARGPNLGVASACATSADAIGRAFDAIQLGQVEAIFTGGSEAAVTPIGIIAFDQLRALSRRNADPAAASRPFDLGRDGFVLAEGGAVLVLEELGFALRRGAEPLAEVLGYAATSDAVHATAPDPEGQGAARCMQLALQRAGLQPEQVGYINAHGTATPSGDPAETRAIKTALGDQAYRIPVSSTKSMTGHLLGGAGALEAAICVQALRSGWLPPTTNLDQADPDCDLDYIPNQARQVQGLQAALSNSMGFGGHNVTLALAKFEQ